MSMLDIHIPYTELFWAVYPFIYMKLPSKVNTALLWLPTVVYGFKLVKKLYISNITITPDQDEMLGFQDLLKKN